MNGELWRAHRVDGGPLLPGERVTVEAVGEDLAAHRRIEETTTEGMTP